MTPPTFLTLDALARPGIRHGYFGRRDGVSTGLYAGRNVGYGSNDEVELVRENRARVTRDLDLPAKALVTVHQIHSPTVAVVDQPWPREQAPQADALVTRRPGVALGILTADCVPVLFADPAAGVVGAAHAGWKGAFTGVLEATVKAMADLGADPARIVAGVGPHIGRDSYEVGPEFKARFVEADAANDRFFSPAGVPITPCSISAPMSAIAWRASAWPRWCTPAMIRLRKRMSSSAIGAPHCARNRIMAVISV